MKKGDIVIVPFPFTDLSSNKKRPALVLLTTEQDVVLAFNLPPSYSTKKNHP